MRAFRRPHIRRFRSNGWRCVSHIFGLGHGVHGGAARRHSASGGRRLSFLAALGRPARRVIRGVGQCFSGFGELSGLLRRAVGTTSAAPIYLNALPFLFEWVRHGKLAIVSESQRAVYRCCRRSPRHAALWSIFFAVPVLALALLDREDGERTSSAGFCGRALSAIAVVVGAAIAIVLLPFWIALIHYPVTQTPIPHPSRANYILEPAVGSQLLRRSLWSLDPGAAVHFSARFDGLPGFVPCCFGFWVAFLLGLGGTTPVGPSGAGPRIRSADHGALQLLGDVARVCRLWGCWPRSWSIDFECRQWWVLTTLAAFTCALAVAWATYRPADAEDFKVDSVAAWLNRDGHDQYRYVTLGIRQ